MKVKKYGLGVVLVLSIVLLLLYFLFNTESLITPHFKKAKSGGVIEVSDNSCLQCHTDTQGYSSYHNPEIIGCASCHLGNEKVSDKQDAHEGMVLIPGNLSDAQETCGKCHASELHKVRNSLMTTNSGIVAVDKFFFGEADSLDYHYHIQDIQFSAADKHLRDLCANCHLGAEKKEFGAIDQLSRGGGCNACHLNYSEDAKSDLEKYIKSDKKELPKIHPATNIFVNDMHCFGCHSRSSRISTNYIGLQETLLDEEDVENKEGYTVLQDKRVYKELQEDVHHSKGMLCIDCHSSHEVMGDGKKYAHSEQAVPLQCSDCHFREKPKTIPYDSLDTESRLVFLHRNFQHNDKDILVAKKDNHPLVNTYVDSVGRAYLIGKDKGALFPLNPQPDVCAKDKAHENVSCSSCHSSWTSRCIGCHNQFDPDEKNAIDLLDKTYVKGQWKEYVAEFSASKPALGVREHDGEKIIEPAVPGMILTIDKGSYEGNPETDVVFHRLYAPNSPHTTTKEVRNCKSCHSDPAAIGYGMGKLTYKIKGKTGEWLFTPEYALNENDNLPEDSWIPFLEDTEEGVVNSTRTDFRPFNVEEQKKLLFVGACLQCHDEQSNIMNQTLEKGLKSVLKNISAECILPDS